MNLTDGERAELQEAFALDIDGRIESLRAVLARAANVDEGRIARGTLLFQAHAIRGAATLLGLADVVEAASTLEAAARRATSRAEEAERAASELLAALERFRASHHAAPPGRHGAAGGPITVLHVEDNEANRRLVAAILAHRPSVRLLEADSGEEGIRLASTPGIALVLLDLRLPGISGETVLERLRAAPETSHLRIVVVSAEARSDERDRLFASGADDYLVKPYDVTSLLSVVDAAVQQGRR
jgi:CheY-like chemotaxis protein